MRCYAPSSMAFVCAHRSYKMVDVEKCPYIEYKIQGLSGIIRSVYKELHADHETGAADNKTG